MRKRCLGFFWVGKPFVGLPVSQCSEEEAFINRRSLDIHSHSQNQQLPQTSALLLQLLHHCLCVYRETQFTTLKQPLVNSLVSLYLTFSTIETNKCANAARKTSNKLLTIKNSLTQCFQFENGRRGGGGSGTGHLGEFAYIPSEKLTIIRFHQ